MAQAGFTPIQLYYSTTASAVPTAGNLASGELAINISDGKLYYKNASNVVTLLATAGTVSSQWVTSGSDIYYNTGNVGIGTSSPAYKFHVQNASANTDTFVGQSSTVGLFTQWRYNATTASAYGEISTYGGSNALYIQGQSGGGNTIINLTSGNVGIGTSSPLQRFTAVNTSITGGAPASSGSAADPNAIARFQIGSVAVDLGAYSTGTVWLQPRLASNYATNFSMALQPNGGNVGIGTSSPGQKFVVSGGRTSLIANSETYALGVGYSSSTGFYYIGATNSATPDLVFSQVGGSERARITNAGGFSVGTTSDPGTGAIYATGNITAYFSDNRLKTRLGGIENALDKVEKLSGFYYEANETAQALGYKPKREVGVSAQEVQAVLPEVVSPAPVDQQYLTVDYERLVPLLIEAIKELRAEVRALKGV